MAGAEMPIFEKASVKMLSPERGLVQAVQAKLANGEFGELNALYVRKSSAEINLCK